MNRADDDSAAVSARFADYLQQFANVDGRERMEERIHQCWAMLEKEQED